MNAYWNLDIAARYAQLVSAVLGIFSKTVFDSLIRRARAHGAAAKAQCGAVTFIQRFGSSLNLKMRS
jgi:hypothetical protein